MKRLIVAGACAVTLAVVASAGGAHGQIPPPPPPPSNATATPTATATATATPTATATSTPIPLFVQLKLAHKSVKVGSKQKVTVTTVPNATVRIVIFFPNRHKRTHNGTADSGGAFTWTYKQRSGRTTSKSHTAKVRATVLDNSGASKQTSKKYAIH